MQFGHCECTSPEWVILSVSGEIILQFLTQHFVVHHGTLCVVIMIK